MSKLIQLFNPTPAWMAQALASEHTQARDDSPLLASVSQGDNQVSRLVGMVVGFIDNAKPNFRYLVDDLSSILTAHYRVAQVHIRQKRAASLAAPDAMLQELLASCDLVIAGSGD